jgi:hypothetical protein
MDSFYKRVRDLGPRTAIAKGDNFPAVLIYQADSETRLYHPDGEVITGFEAARHREGMPIDISEKEQGKELFFDSSKSDKSVTVMRPQRFRTHAKRGEYDIFVGAGYDLEIDDFLEPLFHKYDVLNEELKEAEIVGNLDKIKHLEESIRGINFPDVPLNGSFTDPSRRKEKMIEALRKCGYGISIPLGMKKVSYPVISLRSSGITDVRNLTPDNTFESESIATRLYLTKKGVSPDFLLVHGGSDDAVVKGDRDAAAGVSETGSSIIDEIEKIRLVYENDVPAVVMFSETFCNIPEATVEEDPVFWGEFEGWVEQNRENLRRSDNDIVKGLFTDYYTGLDSRVKTREKILGLE